MARILGLPRPARQRGERRRRSAVVLGRGRRKFGTRHPRIGVQRQGKLFHRGLAQVEMHAMVGNFVVGFEIEQVVVVGQPLCGHEADAEILAQIGLERLHCDHAVAGDTGRKPALRDHRPAPERAEVEAARQRADGRNMQARGDGGAFLYA